MKRNDLNDVIPITSHQGRSKNHSTIHSFIHSFSNSLKTRIQVTLQNGQKDNSTFGHIFQLLDKLEVISLHLKNKIKEDWQIMAHPSLSWKCCLYLFHSDWSHACLKIFKEPSASYILADALI